MVWLFGKHTEQPIGGAAYWIRAIRRQLVDPERRPALPSFWRSRISGDRRPGQVHRKMPIGHVLQSPELVTGVIRDRQYFKALGDVARSNFIHHPF
jgi:hypothetical protein